MQRPGTSSERPSARVARPSRASASGTATSSSTTRSLLIEPEAAKQYEASIKKPDPGGGVGTGDGSGGTTSGGTSENSSLTSGQTSTTTGSATGTTAGTATTKPKSFHGSIQIAPSTAKMRLVEVADEIISVLAGDPNASLNITLEINAEFPTGVSDQIKRAVSENATSLAFKTKSWE